MSRKLIAILTAVAMIGCFPSLACASGRPSVTSTRSPLPPPDISANAAVPQEAYRIGPLDTLDISVFHVDSLNRTVQVDSSGEINFPLIGAVTAARKTSTELAHEIAAKLGERYLQNPQVTVFVKQSLSQKFTVEGAVKAPGVYDVQGRMTLLQAIATAQGVEQSAVLRNVVIFRVVNEKRMAGVVNLADVRKGKIDDPQIYPNDVIVVTGSNSMRVWQGIVGATPLFLLFGL